MESEYAVKISLSKHEHDNPEALITGVLLNMTAHGIKSLLAGKILLKSVSMPRKNITAA